MEDEDFEEEEVWATVRERKDESPKTRRTRDSTGSSTTRRLPTPSKMNPRSNANAESRASGGTFRQSAPVAIPDWSEIYRHQGSSESHSYRFDGDKDGQYCGPDHASNDEDYEEDDDDDKVPPHEWLAKKMARSQISSSSMCEGAGRTLKGRDLSKMRNAVLTRTGFLE
ncbi:nuclear polyadenylated RNA-binding protein 3 [Cocos nucifera]|uniref:Nuclear polyadenylated RNA-binding protein 3 n=1 Tax=Cocos nucifera TaxID=13894 RepID=A0A8K0NCL1_COCNU|nr:nuclear polyadenylated RNA-binding protein 3 [Cocos nucifera]